MILISVYNKYTYEEVKTYVENLGYFLISEVYKNNRTKLILKDKIGFYYVITFECIKRGQLPYFTHKSNPYTIQNIRLWCKLNNKPFELISEIYKNNRINLKWKCLKESCQEIFEINFNNMLHNHYGCPYCSGRQVGLSNCLATKNPNLTKEWHSIKNGSLTPYDVTCGGHKRVWWLCEKGHEWEATIYTRNKSQCPYCAGKYPTKDYNLLIIKPILCEEWDYKKNSKKPEEYTPKSQSKVWWKCKECEHEWESTIFHRSDGRGCPQCNKSKGQKYIQSVLKIKNIIFEEEYDKFKDLLSDLGNPLRFDFAVFEDKEKIKLKCLLEYDGEQHFKMIKGWITKEEFLKIKYHDQLKNNYCEKYNIPLLRIPYWEFDNIEKILLNYLN